MSLFFICIFRLIVLSSRHIIVQRWYQIVLFSIFELITLIIIIVLVYILIVIIVVSIIFQSFNHRLILIAILTLFKLLNFRLFPLFTQPTILTQELHKLAHSIPSWNFNLFGNEFIFDFERIFLHSLDNLAIDNLSKDFMIVLLNNIDLTLKFLIFVVWVKSFFECTVIILVLTFLNIVETEDFSSKVIELIEVFLLT